MSSGLLALPSICLRCQLHEAILQTGTLRNAPRIIAQRCRAFSTHRPRLQEAQAVFKGVRKISWNGEKYVTKRGKRQRVVQHAFKGDSKRSNTAIILEDLPADKDKAKVEAAAQYANTSDAEIATGEDKASPSAKEIESAVIGRNLVPGEAEVIASIQALQTQATKKGTVVDVATFERHLQDLARKYTVAQLSRYLFQSIRSQSGSKTAVPESQIKDGIETLQTSQWRPGRTPLTQRPAKAIKKAGPATKLKIAEQILRLAWSIIVESEEQEEGELEVKLQPWQLSLLFDLSSDGKPYYEKLVGSPMLLEKSEVEPYQPGNLMRITGRRHDAEEIARQLKLALLDVAKLEWDVKSLMPAVDTSAGLPTAMLRPEDISYVAKLTNSTIAYQDDGIITIYSMDQSGINNARRLLLSLLDLPSTSFNGVSHSGYDAVAATSALPAVNSNVGIHRRHHDRDLVRIVQPSGKEGSSGHIGNPLDFSEVAIALSLANELDAVQPLRRMAASAESDISYWREQAQPHTSEWKAKFCTLLHSKDKPLFTAGASAESTAGTPQCITQHTIPGLDILLSHFEVQRRTKAGPKQCESPPYPIGGGFSAKYQPLEMQRQEEPNDDVAEKRLPYIVAHLKPSSHDANSRTALPRLEMRFHFSMQKESVGTRYLILTGIKAVIDEQTLTVPLPGSAVDLLFSRQSNMLASTHAAKMDLQIQHFVRQVQRSARESEGALTAPAELRIKLPSWLVEREASENVEARQDVSVNYIFERFEQIEKLDFEPGQDKVQEMDNEVKSLIEELPEGLYIKYKEVEGGAIYGNSTMLGLGFRHGPSVGKTNDSQEAEVKPSGGSSLAIASTALRFAHLLTRANSGSLQRMGENARG